MDVEESEVEAGFYDEEYIDEEYYDDDDDGDLMVQALPVSDGVVKDLNEALLSPDDYLKYVRYERSQVPQVVTMDRTNFRSKPVSCMNDFLSTHVSHVVNQSLAWQEKQIKNFNMVTERLQNMEKSKSSATVYELPAESDYEGWIKFCFGNGLDGNPPVLSLISQLKKTFVPKLISYFNDHLASSSFTHLKGQWLFSTMAALEKPLQPSTHHDLREICQSCRRIRHSMTNSEDQSLIEALSLIICLVSCCFGQRDLADTVS